MPLPPTTSMSNSQFVEVRNLVPRDRRGRPARLDPDVPVQLVNSDPAVLRAELLENTEVEGVPAYNFNIFAVGAAGSDVMNFIGDAAPGTDEERFVLPFPFNISAARANVDGSTFEIGTPQEQE